MSLSKQQKIIFGTSGGVFALAFCGLGYLLYDSNTARVQADENLTSSYATFKQYYEAKVFPSKKSIDSVKTNATSFTAWYDSAYQLASEGDKVFAEETPPIFKQRLQSEVRRMREHSGNTSDGKIAASTFLFGFEQYLGESGVLPDVADVPQLAVQLDSISTIVDLFAEAGILEVQKVERLTALPSAKKTAKKEDARGARGKKNAEEQAPAYTKQQYAFTVMARPQSLVNALNDLTGNKRFIVVEDISFKQSADSIVNKLTANADAKSGKPGVRRSRRGSMFAQMAEKKEEKKPEPKGDDLLVIDPELDAPIQVELKIAVYDFGRAKSVVKETK